jgi:glycosyltransferase domain-containing protein
MNLTIVIPTKDRLDFFYKIIDYYSQKKFTCKILIIDSSSKKIFNIKKKYIILKKQKKIKIFHIFGKAHEVIKIGAKAIKTKYVAQSGDDDFYILSGLKAAINFLKRNKSYIGVFGKSYLVEKYENKKIVNLISDNFNSISSGNSYKRLMMQIYNYKNVFFSVMITKKYKKSYSLLNKEDYPSMEFFDELQLSYTLVVLGKFKKINNNFLIRYVGHKRNVLPKNDFKNDIISLRNIFNFLNNQSKKKYYPDVSKIWWYKVLSRYKYKAYNYVLFILKKILSLFYLNKILKFLFKAKDNENIKKISLLKEIEID